MTNEKGVQPISIRFRLYALLFILVQNITKACSHCFLENNFYSSVTRNPIIILVENLTEQLIPSSFPKQSHRRPKFHCVNASEDLSCRQAIQQKQSLRYLPQPFAEHGMLPISQSLISTSNTVIVSIITASQPLQLRENEPHPMAPFPPDANLFKSRLIL